MKWLTVIVAGVSLCISSSAYGQGQTCAPRDPIVEHFAEDGFAPTARGLDERGVMVEVLTSEDGRWILHVVRPDGMACFVAGGTDWSTVEWAPVKRDNPA